MMVILLFACREIIESDMKDNPLIAEWNTPYGVPPFHMIDENHYIPAYKHAIVLHEQEINAITENREQADFENTIAAFDHSGRMLERIDNLVDNLNSACTNSKLQKIAKEVAPMVSAHNDNIMLNKPLFERIKTVYEQKENFGLNTEQQQLLDKTYKAFVRGGANLSEEKKERFREINKQLALLSLEFHENNLAETNNFRLVIEDEKNLSGLPESVISTAAETASTMDMQGKWVFTLHKSSLIPFLTYADNRELRKYLFNGYISLGNNDDAYDNKAIVNKMVNMRLERANMLGYKTHADYVLEDNMAKDPEKVYQLIGDLMEAALPVAKNEAAELQAVIDSEDGGFNLEPWDWWYYAEKLKKQKFNFDDEALRPYFQLDKVRQGAFDVAGKLYGLQFVQRHDIPVYHPDAKTYEVKDTDGSTLGLLYMDFYPRKNKRSGAWMTAFRKQYKENGRNVVPIIQVVTNFSKPTGDKPALLSMDEASTLFHEFGHALHGLLSDCNYVTLSGTAVPRDFVELPSQVMENWAADPEVLAMYACHYQTGEPIPDELINKMKEAKHFNKGFETVEFMAAALLDMDWHTITENKDYDVTDFENNSLKKMNLMPEIAVRYRSPYFAHIFAGGYSAGYYSYAWAEVLDADAFEAFKENGIFDSATASAFRSNILSKGGTDEPMKLYVQFRGKEPSIDAMLERKGLKTKVVND